MKYFLVILILSLAVFGQVANIQVTPAGTATGNCTGGSVTILTPTQFNTSTNWGNTTGKIGNGTQVLVCGTFTGTTGSTMLSAQGGGSSGSPILVTFDFGTVFTSPVWGYGGNTAGAIVDNGHAYITFNGTNATIQNTANGSTLANHTSSTAVAVIGASNVTVENFTISNLCVVTNATTCTDISTNWDVAIYLSGAHDHITVSGNTIHDTNTGIMDNCGTTTVLDTFTKNKIYNINWGIGVGGNGSGTALCDQETIAFNDIYSFSNWDASGDHHDGTFAYTNSGTTPITNCQIYSNKFHGDSGSAATAFIFTQGNGGTVKCQIYNNLIVQGRTIDYNGNGLISTGGGSTIVNNMIDCNSIGANGAIQVNNDTGSTGGVVKNNIIRNCEIAVNYAAGTVSASDYNDWYNITQTGNGGGNGIAIYPSGCNHTCNTLAAWRSGTSQDAHTTITNPSLTGKYMLSPGSSAIGAGVNLTSLGIVGLLTGAPANFGSNYGCNGACTHRLASGNWDIGAYPYTASVSFQNVTQGMYPTPTTGASTNLTAAVNGGLKLFVFTVGWNTIESNTTAGLYSWTALDNEIGVMLAAYPNALMEPVFAPASDLSPNIFTPDYVLNTVGQNTCFCSSYTGNSSPPTNTCVAASTNHSGVPVMFNTEAATRWNIFIAAVIAHLKAASYHGSIFSFVFGYQKGGENFPQCSAQQQALVPGGTVEALETSWVSMNATQDATIATAFPAPIVPMGNVNCVGNTRTPSGGNNCDLADKEAAVHFANGVGLRTTCVNISDLTNYLTGQPTCGDIFAIFQQYTGPKDFQEGGESSPTGQQGSGQYACLANGNWTNLLPFAQQHWGPGAGPFIHEGLQNDWYGTFASGYTDACWPRTGTGATSTPWTPYVNVLTNMAAGLPHGTSNFIGLSSLSGAAVADTSSSVPPSSTVLLPQNWVNNIEYGTSFTNTITFPSASWTCNGIPYPATGTYANTQAGVQAAINDTETCRTNNPTYSAEIVLPAGTLYSGTTGLTLPQTAGDTSTAFIVLTSSSPLTTGQTVCSHGIQDNVSESTQPGIRNLGCNATSTSYQLGTTLTPISGAFTLANGTVTNTSAYNDIASMPTIECTTNSCNTIQTALWDANNVGPHHFAILNAELRPQAGVATPNAPFAIGQGTETLTSQIPTHIHLAYSYLHGDWTDAPMSGCPSACIATGSPTGANSIPNDIALQGCIYCSVAYNYIDGSIRPGAEGHGIQLSLVQQIKLVHNWIEGNSIPVLCGGWSAAIPISGFITCQDYEDRGNRYTYPYSWLLAFDGGFCPAGLSCGGHSYVRKNGHEAKFASRYLVDGNIIENVDNSGAQSGIAMSVKTNQTSGGPSGSNYWTINQNQTITNNVLRNTCRGATWGFRSSNVVNGGGGVALPTTNGYFQNNLTYNISLTNPGCNLTGSSASPVIGLTISNNDGSPWAATAQRDALGLTTTLTLTSVTGGTQSVTNVGDHVSVYGCTDTSFNIPTTQMGPPALNGTNPTGLTVVYANPGTANATTTGCTFNNLQGWPQYLIFTHNSEFINSTSAQPNDPYAVADGGSVPYSLSRNMSFTNDIFVGGGFNSTFGEGGTSTTLRTEQKAFDPTTLVFNNNILAGRDSLVTCPGHGAGSGGVAACYTEYSNTSVASVPATLYGIPTSYCTTNDPTSGSCTGIFGAMSTSSFPTVLNDWNQYRLCHATDANCNSKASLYAAGQANQGSDGLDLGFNPTTVNAAEVSNQYVCATSCGTGPYPDH